MPVAAALVALGLAHVHALTAAQITDLDLDRLADPQPAAIDEPQHHPEPLLADDREEPRHSAQVSTCGNVCAEGERTSPKSFQSRRSCRLLNATRAATSVRIDEGE